MSTSVIKVNTPSVFTLVSNLITVEAALETVSEKEGNQSFLDLKEEMEKTQRSDAE